MVIIKLTKKNDRTSQINVKIVQNNNTKFDKYIYFTYISNLDNPHYTSIRIMVVNLSPFFCNLQNVHVCTCKKLITSIKNWRQCRPTYAQKITYLFVGVLD